MKTFRIILVSISVFTLPLLSVADLPHGYIVGWGNNALYGCSGVPSAQSSAGVVTIADQVLANAVAITAGSDHKMALLSDGTVFSWGDNYLGDATGFYSGTEVTNGLVIIYGNVLSNVVAISPGSLSLKSDGTVVGWRFNRDTNFIAGLSNIIVISQNLALKKDGTVVAWGRGIHGEQYGVPAGLSNVVAVTVGRENVALKADGTVVAWYGGSPIEFVPVPAGLSNVVAIAGGALYHLALKKDGTVFGWGVNDSGEATGVATRDDSSGLVTIGGQVLTNIVAIAANGGISPSAGHSLALKRDGTIASWGYSPYNRLDVPAGLSNVVAIAVGDGYCLAITTNRAVGEKFRH
jgi:alpha-tubulin suppressor-like RCC1 family protein